MLNLQALDLKEEIEELKRNDPGQERGNDIKFLVHYVRQKEGDEGFKKLEAELKRLGYNLPDVKKIDNLDWIPSSLCTIFMLASAKFFNWQEKDIIEMGSTATSFHSTLKRFFIRYFLSPKKTLEMAARGWRKFYTFGEAELVRYDEKKKIMLVRLKNFKKHPITCIYFQGLFSKIIEMTTGSKQVTAQETKCMFREDPYHEFVFRWK